jgi:hypothetical protein
MNSIQTKSWADISEEEEEKMLSYSNEPQPTYEKHTRVQFQNCESSKFKQT